MKKILTLVLCLIAVSFACQSGGLVQAQIEDTHDVVLDYSNVKSTRFAASKSAAVENALYSQGIGETVDDIDTVEMNTVCSELEVDENMEELKTSLLFIGTYIESKSLLSRACVNNSAAKL